MKRAIVMFFIGILLSLLIFPGTMKSTQIQDELASLSFQTKMDLNFSTFLGASDFDSGFDIAVDGNGNIYVTGHTMSADFPTLNAYNATYGGGYDVFVTSFTPNGTLRWSTYLGGLNDEEGYGIAVDSIGNIYVTGYTLSANFPTLNAYNATYGGGYDAFVTSFSSNGTLRWSTYLGGSEFDRARGIAVDKSGNIYITGTTTSYNFPILNGSQNAYGGSLGDVFVVSFMSNGTLRWSTYLGGSGVEYGKDIAVDNNGNVYVTGFTGSGNFPTLNAYNATYGGGYDAFFASFFPNGTLHMSSFLGGSGYDVGKGIFVGNNGSIYITGDTESQNFPTFNAYNATYGGGRDVFVASFTSNATLLWSTYLGGLNDDEGKDIFVSNAENVFVIGTTSSQNFPTFNAFDSSYVGTVYTEAFVTSFSKNGELRWSTYFGGSYSEEGEGITGDSSGNLHIVGDSNSVDFPLKNAIDTKGVFDAFVAKAVETIAIPTVTVTFNQTTTQTVNQTFTINQTTTQTVNQTFTINQTTTQTVSLNKSIIITTAIGNVDVLAVPTISGLFVFVYLRRKRKASGI